jgi:hypothetical protein
LEQLWNPFLIVIFTSYILCYFMVHYKVRILLLELAAVMSSEVYEIVYVTSEAWVKAERYVL